MGKLPHEGIYVFLSKFFSNLVHLSKHFTIRYAVDASKQNVTGSAHETHILQPKPSGDTADFLYSSSRDCVGTCIQEFLRRPEPGRQPRKNGTRLPYFKIRKMSAEEHTESSIRVLDLLEFEPRSYQHGHAAHRSNIRLLITVLASVVS